jgi:hypothetical protein
MFGPYPFGGFVPGQAQGGPPILIGAGVATCAACTASGTGELHAGQGTVPAPILEHSGRDGESGGFLLPPTAYQVPVDLGRGEWIQIQPKPKPVPAKPATLSGIGSAVLAPLTAHGVGQITLVGAGAPALAGLTATGTGRWTARIDDDELFFLLEAA